MLNKRDEIKPFLDEDFDKYVANMSQPSAWGGEPELSVVPDCLTRSVEVYMVGATGLQVMSTYNCHDHLSKTAVKILFNGIGHYDLLVDTSPTSKL